MSIQSKTEHPYLKQRKIYTIEMNAVCIFMGNFFVSHDFLTASENGYMRSFSRL